MFKREREDRREEMDRGSEQENIVCVSMVQP